MSHLPYSHRSIVQNPGGRVPEYLENLKSEFETLSHDVNLYKMQRDDFERKLQAQMNEMSSIQATIFELEKNHKIIKQQYDEEIIRLQRQLNLPGQAISGGRDLSSPLTFRSVSPAPSSTPLLTAPPSTPVSNPSMPSTQPPTTSTPTTPITGGLNGQSSRNPSALMGSGSSPSALGMPEKNPLIEKRPNNFGSGHGLTPAAKRQRNGPSGVEEAEFYQNQQQQQGSSFPPLNPTAGGLGSSEAPSKHAKTEKKEEYPLPALRNEHTSSSSSKDLSRNGGASLEMTPEYERPRRTEETEEAAKENKNGTDWIVGYNPGVQTNLNIDLMHNLNHQSVVCCVKFSADGKYLSTGCNKSAQIYDVESGKKVHTFSDDSAKEGDLYIRSVCFSPDGTSLATGAEDKTVKVWDIQQKRILHTFTGHELDIYSLDYSYDGRFIVSGSGDKKAKIWDLEKGKCAFTLGNDEVGPKDGVTSVAISPDGRLVAAGSLDRIVRLWDAQTGYFLERYEGHADSVYSVAFSPDGKSLASGSLDKTLRLWDLSGSRARSRCRSTFNGHKDFVLSVAFSPDGNWLISGSKDRSVQFWDPRTAVTHMMLQGHKNSVISVGVSPTGGVFATGSGDYRARLWKYELQQ
eukprot:TRINITY_DN3688_c0_g1_i1.p1 TRINITY_DN3688_c0_g1~~TRINITY_DN3688_c0_g1_i1.p1  ORF type:complete len:631 (+),score=141.31 TRINITY_DN3688_c0_g1_i1:213-2105(+)